MKILVLTKRQYMAKDMLDDRFGRFRELPLELARLGHEVSGLCLSYRPRPEGAFPDREAVSGSQVDWQSLNLGTLVVPGLLRHLARAQKVIKAFKPDLLWACSDSFHAILGVWLGKWTRTRCVVDLYDNFESFRATRMPGILPLFKQAVRNADGVTCVSKPLADLVVQKYQRNKPTLVVENGVRADLFYPREQRACRRRLGLPDDAKIIGTAGALHENRGIHALFRGFDLLASKEANLHLAIAGPRDRSSRIPDGPKVHDLGILPFDEVPLFLNALDVAVVCNRDSSFGRYSFPQKAYEIMSCRTPIVAAALGSMKDLLAQHPECLFEPENPESLAKAVRAQLSHPTTMDLNIPGWPQVARKLEEFFRKIVAGAK